MKKTILLLFTLTLFALTFAQKIATTEDGKKVELYDNGTWKYKDSKSTTITRKSGEYFCVLRDYYSVNGKTYVVADFIDSQIGEPIRNRNKENYVFLFSKSSTQGNLYCSEFNQNELSVKRLLNHQVFRITLKNGVIDCLGQQMGM